MLNKSGQIAPDAAQFDGGRQKAPVVNVKVGDKTITAPLYVQPGLADFHPCRDSWTWAFKCWPSRAGHWLRCNTSSFG